MSDDRTAPHDGPAPRPSLDDIASLDRYLDALARDQAPPIEGETADALALRLAAAQLRVAREGAEVPSPQFLRRLETEVAAAVAEQLPRRARPDVTRGHFLRRSLALAGAAGAGALALDVAEHGSGPTPPHELVASGNGRWYDVAAVDDVPAGAAKRFKAGGLVGYVINDNGKLSAISGICTHMGCLLRPGEQAEGSPTLRCLCHGSHFGATGKVLAGLAPTSLPAIALHVTGGRIYALGTRETV